MGVVDDKDIAYLIHEILQTEFGDVNLDGKIDNADFGFILGNFGVLELGWGGGDINGDGVVCNADFGFVLGNFGFVNQAVAAADVVSERPGTAQVYERHATAEASGSESSSEWPIDSRPARRGFLRHWLKRTSQPKVLVSPSEKPTLEGGPPTRQARGGPDVLSGDGVS